MLYIGTRMREAGEWLRCIFHDLFGHPEMEREEDCRECGSNKALCGVCWHHYTVSY